MIALQFIPVVLTLLVLAAHFLRSGFILLTAGLLILIGLLALPRRWVARTAQVVLLLGAAEWIRTMIVLLAWRAQTGQPARRMVVILSVVALATAASALLFRTARMRRRYGLERSAPAAGDGDPDVAA